MSRRNLEKDEREECSACKPRARKKMGRRRPFKENCARPQSAELRRKGTWKNLERWWTGLGGKGEAKPKSRFRNWNSWDNAENRSKGRKTDWTSPREERERGMQTVGYGTEGYQRESYRDPRFTDNWKFRYGADETQHGAMASSCVLLEQREFGEPLSRQRKIRYRALPGRQDSRETQVGLRLERRQAAIDGGMAD